MGFALVYGGEHYVVDLLAGVLTGALAWWGAGRLLRRTRAAAAGRTPTPMRGEVGRAA